VTESAPRLEVPHHAPDGVRPTPDKISAARLLRQSLTRLGQGVPDWVDSLASAEPVVQDDVGPARPVNGVNILDRNPGDERPDGERDGGHQQP
jgi:hypothetical protein